MINFPLLLESLPTLLKASLVNVYIAFLAFIIGAFLSVPLALMEDSRYRLARAFSFTYCTFFRGTPMIIQIMFAFYALPQLGVDIPPLASVIFAIGINSAAYLSQVIRSGLRGISKKQFRAAKALGLSSWQAYRYVLFPQCLKNIFPSLGSEIITLLKDSSLASVVGVLEVVKLGAVIRGRTFEAFTVLFAVALVYLFLTSLLTFLIKIAEKRAEKPCSL
jgi:His/Glu/Gln/Arg/opine family amino acid ABC transporter permease subunit